MKTLSRTKRVRPLLLCLLLFGGAALCETLSEPVGQAQGFLKPAAGRDAALAQASGEFRTVAANILWAKVVDHYHHQFMAQGGDWSKNVALLPLLNTIVTLDPHFTQAYALMGGEILPRTGQMGRGEQVLADGIRHNPNDWELCREMSLLLAWREKRYAAALPFARQGLANARKVTDDADEHEFAVRVMTSMTRVLEARTQSDKHETRALHPI